MKRFLLLFCLLGLLRGGQEIHPGNFDIRFEPTAKLQTGAQIPFLITVRDPLHKPLPDAKVTLRIENNDPANTKTFAAPATDPGSYLAKPVFPSAGQWNLVVEVRRGSDLSTRSIEFSVPE